MSNTRDRKIAGERAARRAGRRCQCCGRALEAVRSTRQFCGVACRVAAHRGTGGASVTRVRLTQVDGKLPNLALMRLARFHRDRGDAVYFTRSVEREPGERFRYARVYASAVFAFTLAGLVGIAVSITGNETAQRWGRARVVTVAMSAAAALSLVAGWSAGISALLATLLVLLWNAAIYFDSSALTAGTVQAADKELRGATMGLHSMCGYAGGFIGPLGVGLVLDLAGENALGWGIAFGHLAVITLTGLVILRWLGTRRVQPAVVAAD